MCFLILCDVQRLLTLSRKDNCCGFPNFFLAFLWCSAATFGLRWPQELNLSKMEEIWTKYCIVRFVWDALLTPDVTLLKDTLTCETNLHTLQESKFLSSWHPTGPITWDLLRAHYFVNIIKLSVLFRYIHTFSTSDKQPEQHGLHWSSNTHLPLPFDLTAEL